MEYTLRALQTSDLFFMVRMLNKIGIKNIKDTIDYDEIKGLRKTLTPENESEIAGEIGTKIVFSVLSVVMEHLPELEDDLYAFSANLAGVKAKEIKALPPVEFLDMVEAIVKKEDFVDFFKRASKLMK